MERNIGSRLSSSRWLEAVWEPSTRMNTLPGGLDMIDISGNGDAKLIVVDLGFEDTDSAKVRVFSGSDQVSEHILTGPSCGVVGFYTENSEPRSAVVAVAMGPNVFIYKNMKPHFKYCLPYLDAHPKEREIWHKAGLDPEFQVQTLFDDLGLLLKELGAVFMSPRTLKFLSLDEHHRVEFANQYRRLPLIRSNSVTTIGSIRKDTWNDPASSCLIIGTESGELLVLDPRSFALVEKHHLGWPPVAICSTGLWSGGGKIFVVSRDCRVGSLRKGLAVINLWNKLSAPAIAISPLTCGGVAIVTMDGKLAGFSMKGVRLWSVQLPGLALDMTGLPVPQTGLSLLAISIPRVGVLIYDSQHHVDTITTIEPISAMKFGRMGQEERAMAMITIHGGLYVKILKRTANFNVRAAATNNSITASQGRFVIPKKTRLFVEQSIRERSEAVKIHNTFQQGQLRLRLHIAKKAQQILRSRDGDEAILITLEVSVLGLGPTYNIRTLVTNVSDNVAKPELFLVYRSTQTIIKPRIIDLPLLPSGIPIPVIVKATPEIAIIDKVKVLLCRKGRIQPITSTTVQLPVAEPDIEV